MQKKVLVVSFNPAFRDLLRRGLEESGRYSPVLAPETDAWDSHLYRDDFDLILADLATGEENARTILSNLDRLAPDLAPVVFPPENDPQHPWLEDRKLAACLIKPLHLSALLEALDSICGQPAGVNDWYPEVILDPPTLANLLADTQATAGVLLESGQAATIAGQLDAAGGAEVTTLLPVRGNDLPGDLVRYAHLAATGQDHLLYGVCLSGDRLLVLIFPAEVSYTRARADSQSVMAILQPRSSVPARQPNLAPLPEVQDLPEDEPSAPATLDQLSQPEPDAAASFADLLAGKADPAGEWAHEPNFEQTAALTEESLPAPAGPDLTLEDTRPNHPGNPPPPLEAGFVPAAQKYTCVLVPTLPETSLAGEPGQALAAWLQEFCQTFGWQLERVQAEPHYLLWTVTFTPPGTPGHLARTLRQQSSRLLNEKFPQISGVLNGKDFWAPGFLLVSGGQAPQPAQIEDYIQQTRTRQGYPS